MFGGSKSLKQARLFCDFQILSSAQRYFPWLVESKKALKRPKAKTSWYNEWKWVFFFLQSLDAGSFKKSQPKCILLKDSL